MLGRFFLNEEGVEQLVDNLLVDVEGFGALVCPLRSGLYELLEELVNPGLFARARGGGELDAARFTEENARGVLRPTDAARHGFGHDALVSRGSPYKRCAAVLSARAAPHRVRPGRSVRPPVRKLLWRLCPMGLGGRGRMAEATFANSANLDPNREGGTV